MRPGTLRVSLFCLSLFLASSACIRKKAPPAIMEVNLYSGVQDFVKIGDSEGQIIDRGKKLEPEIAELPPKAADERLSFSKVYRFRSLGMRLYFQQGRVSLIELQEPFRGNIQGKRLQIFSFAAPQGSTWEDLLTKGFGVPLVKASGGRFGAEAFFYSWGDVSFNRMGPNELAIYRDREISNYRQKNFGRDVKFFQD